MKNDELYLTPGINNFNYMTQFFAEPVGLCSLIEQSYQMTILDLVLLLAS